MQTKQTERGDFGKVTCNIYAVQMTRLHYDGLLDSKTDRVDTEEESLSDGMRGGMKVVRLHIQDSMLAVIEESSGHVWPDAQRVNLSELIFKELIFDVVEPAPLGVKSASNIEIEH